MENELVADKTISWKGKTLQIRDGVKPTSSEIQNLDNNLRKQGTSYELPLYVWARPGGMTFMITTSSMMLVLSELFSCPFQFEHQLFSFSISVLACRLCSLLLSGPIHTNLEHCFKLFNRQLMSKYNKTD